MSHDRVVVSLERTPRLLSVLFALQWLDITYIPVDSTTPIERYHYLPCKKQMVQPVELALNKVRINLTILNEIHAWPLLYRRCCPVKIAPMLEIILGQSPRIKQSRINQ